MKPIVKTILSAIMIASLATSASANDMHKHRKSDYRHNKPYAGNTANESNLSGDTARGSGDSGMANMGHNSSAAYGDNHDRYGYGDNYSNSAVVHH